MSSRLPVGWEYRKLDDLGYVGRGRSRHRPRNDPSLYGGDIPFFQTGDVREADFWLRRPSSFYNEKGLAQSKIWEPNTLCITIAANIADTAILAVPGCFPDSVVGFVADPEKSDVKYIKYYLDLIKEQMQGISRGTTQDNLSLDKLLTFDIAVPPLDEQRRIASILSAYDDLIENNRRRIEILEEMARNIYREWFVHFRFPGHEDVQFVDSPHGPIPEGWEVKRLGDLASLHRKAISPAKQLEQAFAHYSLPAFDESQLPVIESGESIRSNKYLMPEQCVLLSKLNPRIPRVWLVLNGPPEPAIASTEFMVLTPEEPVSIEFLFSHCRSDEFMGTLAGVAGGTSTSHQRVKPDHVLDSELVVADSVVMSEFTEIASPLLKLSLQLRQRNRVLSQTRDLLLPRLVAGELALTEFSERAIACEYHQETNSRISQS